MKKVFITFSLLALTFLISGCGCSKKNLTLECSSGLDEYNEKKYVEAEFEDGFLKKQVIEIVTVFDDEVIANRFYEMYKDSEVYDVSINKLEVVLKQNVDNFSTDDVFKYDNFYKSMIDKNFECKKK